MGRSRVDAAVRLLHEVTGVSHPMLFLKMGAPEWTPVGEETLYSLVPGKGSVAVAICDADGNAKALGDWVEETKGAEFARDLEAKGVPRFDGEVKLPL